MLARLLTCAAVAALLFGSGSAHAAPFDGRWSVLLVTESGDCEVYRVNVSVNNGRVSAGQDGPQISGRVSSRGAVQLNATYGRDVASATGSVSGDSGRGSWSAPTRGCAGRWEAERRE
jgi:hypothetical protein